MVARIAPLAVVVLVLVVACYDDPLEVLKPDGARPSHTSETPSGSGIFNGAESFVAGNPMRNFAGGAPYNYGYYSDGPDPGDGWNDSDQARIAIPHDSLLVDLTNFSFETWVRVSYSSEWEYGLIALNSNHQTNSTGQLDLGYFLLEYVQSSGWIEFTWGVSSYHESFGGDWSFIYAEPPPLDPDSGRVMHVVGLHDANVISLYIDGSLAATADISFRQDLSDIFSWGGDIEKPLMIAGSQCAQDDPSCNVSLAGSIGESAFYRRALTPTEIQEHYQVGTGTPPTEPDSLNDPYRDLVLSHQPDGYWRHRESELHGQPIDGEQLVDVSGNTWHGTYRSLGGVQDTTFAITVTCPSAPVTRLDVVSCSAAWEPTTISSGEILFEWTFKGDSIRVLPEAFAPPVPVDSSGSGLAEWTGPAVLGGDVHLTAHWQGLSAADSAKFAVNPRTGPEWTDLLVLFDSVPRDIPTYHDRTFQNQPLPQDSNALGLMGLNVNDSTESAVWSDLLSGSYKYGVAPAGPNAGLMVIVSHDQRVARAYMIRTWLTGKEDPYFTYITTGKDPITNRTLLAERRVDDRPWPRYEHPDSTAYLEGIMAHETYGENGSRGHQGEFEMAAKSAETCGRLPQLLERIVSESAAGLVQRANLVGSEAVKALGAASDHDRVHSNYADVPLYEVVGSTTDAVELPYLRYEGDLPEPADPARAPNFGCSRNYQNN